MRGVIGAAARLLSHVAAIALLAMVLINVVDVGMRSAFNEPIFGTFEIVELLLAVVAFLVIAETFLREGHITIELIDGLVGPRGVRGLKVFGMGATLVYLALLVWAMITPAVDIVRFNEITFSLNIPKIWEYAPVLLGIAAALVAALVIFVRDMKIALGRDRPT
jgi:TRAP-type C4-dicarboxylate transport system permease small subunit